jgi:hypothetical protein
MSRFLYCRGIHEGQPSFPNATIHEDFPPHTLARGCAPAALGGMADDHRAGVYVDVLLEAHCRHVRHGALHGTLPRMDRYRKFRTNSNANIRWSNREAEKTSLSIFVICDYET